MKARRARESQEQTTLRLSQVVQGSALTQSSQSQEGRVTCWAGRAAYRASLRSRLKNAERSRMNAQAAATAFASRASETHHLCNERNAAATAKSRAIETLDRRRVRQSRDAVATASARAAERPLRRFVRNSTNAATTARSRAAETFDRKRAR
ncbi:unnamed protein product [Acanthosepion pharaonis]|uniref:Uncharacterized protein n=1 Tax=Acanthosepion pharaonis TaxID=158019 RepID=A0A812ANH4_ACAPH|nr:unnamed protein product [Sepia pharaonis]